MAVVVAVLRFEHSDDGVTWETVPSDLVAVVADGKLVQSPPPYPSTGGYVIGSGKRYIRATQDAGAVAKVTHIDGVEIEAVEWRLPDSVR